MSVMERGKVSRRDAYGMGFQDPLALHTDRGGPELALSRRHILRDCAPQEAEG